MVGLGMKHRSFPSRRKRWRMRLLNEEHNVQVNDTTMMSYEMKLVIKNNIKDE